MSTPIATARPSDILHARRQEIVDLIEARGGRNPRVFGSVARGTDTAESDIDILVNVEPDRAWEFVSLPRELSELLGVHVDVVSEGGLKGKHRAILAESVPLMAC